MMTLYYQLDNKMGLLVAKVAQKSFLISVIPGGHFKFRPLEKNADIFGRDLGANFLRNGPGNSIRPSKCTSRRVVTELGYMAILYRSFIYSL